VNGFTEVLTTFQQWALFCGVVIVVGCVTWVAVVARRIDELILREEAHGLRLIESSIARIGGATVLLLIGAWMLRMVVQVMGFRDPFAPLWDDVSFLLFETFWGTVWMAQGVVLPLLGATFWVARRHPWAWRVAGALVLALVATLSLSSHAMGVDSARPLIVTADAVHALAAGTWIGSLVIILTAGRPSGPDHRLFAAQLRSFSPLAMVSVAALTSMGVVLAWTHLGTVSDLWTTGYGRVLSAKVSLVGVVLLFGLWNWRKGLGTVDTEEGATKVQRHAALEVSLATCVLLLTAVLVHSVKP